MDWEQRVEEKIDKILDKVELHSGRISSLEASVSFLKWGISTLITVSSIAALALSKYIIG